MKELPENHEVDQREGVPEDENREKTGEFFTTPSGAVMPVGRRFSSSYQPNNTGRKRNVLKKYEQEFEMSKTDIENLITHLLSLSMTELMNIVKDKSSSVIELSFASAVMRSIKKGEIDTLETMLNRKIGKPDFNFKGSIGADEDAINEIKRVFDDGIKK